MSVTLTCDECGGSYETTKHKAERSENNYCSRDCYGSSLGEGKVQVACEWCGAEFKRYASNIKGDTFCDAKCHNQYQRAEAPAGADAPGWKGGTVEVVCDHCGNSFEDYPSRVGRGESTYCSPQCFGKDNRAERQDVLEYARDSGKWERVREKILERDNRRCQTCGGDWKLHVHHKTPVSEGGAPFDSNNLITVCRTCHFHIHH